MTIGATPALDAVLDKLAASQHGVVTRRQLIAAGFTNDAIDWRLSRNRLRPLHVGVFQVGPVASVRAREIAAVLACGTGVVSHWSAIAMRQLAPQRRRNRPVDVTVPPHRRVLRPGVRVHRSVLTRAEVTKLDGIPITTVARTLLDLGSVATTRELERAVAAAERGDPNLRSQLIRRLVQLAQAIARGEAC